MLTYQGIVLTKIKYTGNNFILKVFTQEAGVKPFIISLGGKSNKQKQGHTQPLSLINIVCNKFSKGNVSRISEISSQEFLLGIRADIRKIAVALFISEILKKGLFEEEENKLIYAFVKQTVLELNNQKFSPDFHLKFLVQLCRLSGFMPNLNYSISTPYFNAIEGEFESNNILGKNLDADSSKTLNDLFNNHTYDSAQIAVNKVERNKLLEGILQYFQIHFHINSKIKSKEILQEIFD